MHWIWPNFGFDVLSFHWVAASLFEFQSVRATVALLLRVSSAVQYQELVAASLSLSVFRHADTHSMHHT